MRIEFRDYQDVLGAGRRVRRGRGKSEHTKEKDLEYRTRVEKNGYRLRGEGERGILPYKICNK